MTHHPDRETRVLIVTLALIVLLSWLFGGVSVWEYAHEVRP